MCPRGQADNCYTYSNTNEGTAVKGIFRCTASNRLSLKFIKKKVIWMGALKRTWPSLYSETSKQFWSSLPAPGTCSARSHNCVSKFLEINPHRFSSLWACFVEIWTHLCLCGLYPLSASLGVQPEGQKQQETGTHTGTCGYVPPKNPQARKLKRQVNRGEQDRTGKKRLGSVGFRPRSACHVTSLHAGFLRYQISPKISEVALAPIIKTDKLFLALEKPAPCYLPSDCVVPTTSLFLYLKNQGRKGGKEPAWTAQHGRKRLFRFT